MVDTLFYETNGKRYYMGCVRDKPHHDAPRILSQRQLEKLPSAYIIPDLTPVGDQGQEGSCTGNAGDNWYKIYDSVNTGTYFNGSRQQLYQCALVKDGQPSPATQDVGSSLSTMAWVLQNKGVAPEIEFPYTATLGTPVPANVLADAKKHEAMIATRLDATDENVTIANIKAAIVPNNTIKGEYPCMFGYNCYNEIFSVGSDGSIPMPTPGEQPAGGHANVFIGYDDNHENLDGTNGALFLKNSWGTGWGAPNAFNPGGYGWMSYSYFTDTDDAVGDIWSLLKTSDVPVSPPPPVSTVSVASSPALSKDTFVAGSDKAVWVETGTAAWKSLGGIITSDPAVATLPGVREDVFARGNDGCLWHCAVMNDGTVSQWQNLGGQIHTSMPNPSAYWLDANTLTVAVIGTDGAIWEKTWNGTAWSGWTSIGKTLK